MKAIASHIHALRNSVPQIRMIADSAIGRQREPFWFDNESETAYTALVCPCYRIGRLGKNISREFAPRYVDAITLAALIVPEYHGDILDTAEIYFASTNALIPGDDLAAGPENLDVSRNFTCSGSCVDFNPQEFAAEAIERLSRHMTFKTGDRLIDTGRGIKMPVKPGVHIEALLDGNPILRFKIH